MGILLSKLVKLFNLKQHHKLLILGLDNAGKTTLLYNLSLKSVIDTIPTIGANVETFDYNDKLTFIAWDVGGQESLRSTWSSYYQNTRALIIVIDSTDLERMHIIKEEIDTMLAVESLHDAVLLVFANKQGVRGAAGIAQISEMLKLSELKDRTWHIQASSALTGDGLVEGLDWLATKLE